MNGPGDVEREVLSIGPRITVLPVIHGSADCATEVRRSLATGAFDAVAVPLPESFREPVEQAILDLPRPSIVVQEQGSDVGWHPADDDEDDDDSEGNETESRAFNYVPIDPCQPVVAGIRAALEERIPRYYIDLETETFLPYGRTLPDPWALKRMSLAQFAAGVLPVLTRPTEHQRLRRIACMGQRLRDLAIDHRRILLICSLVDWPWIREAYHRIGEPVSVPGAEGEEGGEPATPVRREVDFATLYFMLGELPFITALHERARAELTDHANLTIDGVKELLVAARDAYRSEYGRRSRPIPPATLRTMLRYARNLTLLDRRLTPDLTTLLTAAQQISGDSYALSVLDTARRYDAAEPAAGPHVRMNFGRASFPDEPDRPATMISRLPGPPQVLKRIELRPRPDREERERWRRAWVPFGQCSWPPDDVRIENFRSTVRDRARELMGQDLARTEKFTTSLMDGIDIRETLRRWYDGELYVKVLPPRRGDLDAVVMLFDSPADPRDYPWRTTWYAEHEEESTLAFFASDFRREAVGPGICLAHYGGALFLFPPRPIPDIWTDERLDRFTTLEERLLGAAALHSRHRHIAVVASGPPGAAWRRIARRFRKTWVPISWSQFGESTVQQLRQVHVLSGKVVRSWADKYIRRP